MMTQKSYCLNPSLNDGVGNDITITGFASLVATAVHMLSFIEFNTLPDRISGSCSI
jgi:hypothetical protein